MTFHPVPKPAHWKSKRYMEFVSRQPSMITGMTPCVPHHHRHGSDGGTGLKPSDVWVVPVTSLEHQNIHAGNIALDDAEVMRVCLRQLVEYMVENKIR